MFTVYPKFSKSRVSKAGNAIRSSAPSDEDIDVIENWRASHNYVLNTFQATLRRHARGKEITVAQRLKRRSTIYDKLIRHDGMQLARMHDIAGCRLIFENQKILFNTRNQILNSRFKHRQRNSINDYNYIEFPKENGYRGIHDVYEYVSYTGRADNWNGLLIELQYRTKIQHAWATAVEIYGSLTGNEAKFDRADERHQRFFKLASEILARYYEEGFSKNIDASDIDLLNEFMMIEEQIGALRFLEGLHVSATRFKNARNLILMMRDDGRLEVFGYANARLAITKYFELEESGDGIDIVLVRSDTNEGIRSAFRNYFSDAQDFTALIREAVPQLEL